jgi:hypothetical protein
MDEKAEDAKPDSPGLELGTRHEGVGEAPNIEEFLERARLLGFSEDEIEKMRTTYSREIKGNDK